MKLTDIQYDTAELKIQWAAIEKSRMVALDQIVRKRYAKVTGLDKSDPQELFCFAVGFTEPPPDLTKIKRQENGPNTSDRLTQNSPEARKTNNRFANLWALPRYLKLFWHSPIRS